jgi:hypothetical protein
MTHQQMDAPGAVPAVSLLREAGVSLLREQQNTSSAGLELSKCRATIQRCDQPEQQGRFSDLRTAGEQADGTWCEVTLPGPVRLRRNILERC